MWMCQRFQDDYLLIRLDWPQITQTRNTALNLQIVLFILVATLKHLYIVVVP